MNRETQNTSKNTYILINTSGRQTRQLHIKCGSHIIQEQIKLKILGVTLFARLPFSKRIQDVQNM